MFRKLFRQLFRRRIKTYRPASVSSQMSLHDYSAMVRELTARPTQSQIEDFVAHVASAHSWYKRLPLLPPGSPFMFMIDIYAGCDRTFSKDGCVTHKLRDETSSRFHYSWMTTEEYQRRFAHLAYTSTDQPVFGVVGEGTTTFVEASHILHDSTNRPFVVPAEIVNECTAHVTGVIHKAACQAFVWQRLRRAGVTLRGWPAESGGDKVLHEIIDVCTVSCDDDDESELDVDSGLCMSSRMKRIDKLLLPERARIRAEMQHAIHRLCDLLYE